MPIFELPSTKLSCVWPKGCLLRLGAVDLTWISNGFGRDLTEQVSLDKKQTSKYKQPIIHSRHSWLTSWLIESTASACSSLGESEVLRRLLAHPNWPNLTLLPLCVTPMADSWSVPVGSPATKMSAPGLWRSVWAGLAQHAFGRFQRGPGAVLRWETEADPILWADLRSKRRALGRHR